jgi:hypothetical protein
MLIKLQTSLMLIFTFELFVEISSPILCKQISWVRRHSFPKAGKPLTRLLFQKILQYVSYRKSTYLRFDPRPAFRESGLSVYNSFTLGGSFLCFGQILDKGQESEKRYYSRPECSKKMPTKIFSPLCKTLVLLRNSVNVRAEASMS